MVVDEDLIATSRVAKSGSATWFFSACLCVLIHAHFPRRSKCNHQYILARRQTNMRVFHLYPAARNRQ
jgi:hypothetical protein